MMRHEKSSIKVLFWAAVFCALYAVPLTAQVLPVSRIEDDSALRAAIYDAWLDESPAVILKNKPFIRNLPGGTPVQVRSQARGNEFTVYLSRRWEGGYPGWGPGSWLLTRRMSGEYERIRIFLNNDPNSYIQFRPMEPILESGKSLLDVVVYDAFVVRGLAAGIPFKDLLTLPLYEVLDSLGNKFPRRYFEPDPAASRDVRSLVAAVRSALPALSFTDDGALDENSCYVFIKDGVPQNGSGETGGLNCSGFAKWLVDGILSPLTGRRLSIAPLKTHTVEGPSSLTQNYADSRDSWFGLDWTRNLALEVWRAIRGPASATLRNIEVREAAFAALIDRQRGGAVRGYPGYLANAGFGIEGLRPLLYTLAVDQPGCIYLASVNVERGPAPRMRQHYHVAVLVPWFNEYGVFQTAVFESAAETSLARFMAQHPGAQVNLVRIPVEKRFQFQ